MAVSESNRKRKLEDVVVDDDVDDDTEESVDEEEEEEEEDDSNSKDDNVLQIMVRRVGRAENESLQIFLEQDASVLDLKETIAVTLDEKDDEVVIPVERQRLIFSGKMLRNDAERLVADLHMKAGKDQTHFVHLTPLPKGAAPSVRTVRETPAAVTVATTAPLALSHRRVAATTTTSTIASAAAAAGVATATAAASAHEENLRRAREMGARHRRRRLRRQQQAEGGPSRVVRGLMDAAAYHPYALDLSSAATGVGGLLMTTPGGHPPSRASIRDAAAPTPMGVASSSTALGGVPTEPEGSDDFHSQLSYLGAVMQERARLVEVSNRQEAELQTQLLALHQQQQLQQQQQQLEQQQREQQQQQQQQFLGESFASSLAAAAGGGGGVAAMMALNNANPLCPYYGSSLDAAAAAGMVDPFTLQQLLGNTHMPNHNASAASWLQHHALQQLHLQEQQQQQQLPDIAAIAAAAAAVSARTASMGGNAAATWQSLSAMYPEIAAAAAASAQHEPISDVLERVAQREGIPDMLDRIALDAGQLATTLRQMSSQQQHQHQQQAPSSAAGLFASPEVALSSSFASAAVTPLTLAGSTTPSMASQVGNHYYPSSSSSSAAVARQLEEYLGFSSPAAAAMAHDAATTTTTTTTTSSIGHHGSAVARSLEEYLAANGMSSQPGYYPY